MRMGSHKRDGRRFEGGEADEGERVSQTILYCVYYWILVHFFFSGKTPQPALFNIYYQCCREQEQM